MTTDSSPELWHDSPEMPQSQVRQPAGRGPQHSKRMEGLVSEEHEEGEGLSEVRVMALERLWAQVSSQAKEVGG